MPSFGAAMVRLERFASGFTVEMAETFLPSAGIAQITRRHERSGSRRRDLPSELVAWLVICAGLWRHLALPNVLALMRDSVAASMRWARDGGQVPSSGAISRARSRLGVRPMRRILQYMVSRWWERRGEGHRWRGMALVALDGTTLRMPESAENCAHFPLHHTGPGRVPASYPILRAVIAICATSRVVLACAAGKFTDSEWKLVRRVVRHLPERTLALLDRGFMGLAFLRSLSDAGHEFVVRCKKGRKMQLVRSISPCDRIVRLPIGPRRKNQEWMTLRAVRCQRDGFRSMLVLTSLLDEEAFSAQDIAARYGDRWECEAAFDEIKTHLLGRHVQFRSCSPLLVRQELDGMLIAHNLIRMHMEEAARVGDLSPLRLSYTDCAARLRTAHIRMAQAPARALPEMMARLVADLANRVLPARKRRRYERVVKALPGRYPIRRRNRAA